MTDNEAIHALVESHTPVWRVDPAAATVQITFTTIEPATLDELQEALDERHRN